MTYIFNDSTLQEITDKILYQNNILHKMDCDIENLEGFILNEHINFGEIDGPHDKYISVDDQGRFICYHKHDPLDEPMPFNCENMMFDVNFITDLKTWVKVEYFEFIVMHMKTILEDLRVNV